MNRRSFVSRLTGAIAVITAAPALKLEQLEAAHRGVALYDQHGRQWTAPPPASMSPLDRDLARINHSLRKFCDRFDIDVDATRAETREGLNVRLVDRYDHRNRVTAFLTMRANSLLPTEERARAFVRQVKYSTMRAVDDIRRMREASPDYECQCALHRATYEAATTSGP